MKYKYYSPFFLCFMIGIVYDIILIGFLTFCHNFDQNISNICEPLEHEVIDIIVLIVGCILNGTLVFLQILLVNDYTVFHLMIAYLAINLIYEIFSFLTGFSVGSFIDIIFKFLEFLFGLIYVEIIELNFWGLNVNLKKNIVNRSDKEKKEIINLNSDNNESQSDHANTFINLSDVIIDKGEVNINEEAIDK